MTVTKKELQNQLTLLTASIEASERIINNQQEKIKNLENCNDALDDQKAELSRKLHEQVDKNNNLRDHFQNLRSELQRKIDNGNVLREILRAMDGQLGDLIAIIRLIREAAVPSKIDKLLCELVERGYTTPLAQAIRTVDMPSPPTVTLSHSVGPEEQVCTPTTTNTYQNYPQHYPTEITPELLEDIIYLLRNNQKVPAIKKYREVMSCNLFEAKQAVEAIATKYVS